MQIDSDMRGEQVKAQLYPLGHINRLLEWLVERLPRRRIQVHLEAMPGVDSIHPRFGGYFSKDESPQFRVRLDAEYPAGAWLYLEAALTRHSHDRVASLRGIKDDGSVFFVPVPSNLRGTVREVIRLPEKVVELYWLPMHSTGFFSQSDLLVHRITFLESVLRRLHRVISILVSPRDAKARKRYGLGWKDLLGDLSEAYRKTAQIIIDRYRAGASRIQISDYVSRSAPTSRDKRMAIAKIEGWGSNKPLISVVLPVAGNDVQEMRQTLGSVQSQWYSHWELCIALPAADENLPRFEENPFEGIPDDGRLKVLSSSHSNYHSLVNSALSASRGEWVLFLDVKDRLREDALYRMVLASRTTADAQLIYSDEAFLDENGNICDADFKCDWNPDLFYSTNYVGRLLALHRGVIEKAGGSRAGQDGSDHYDLIIRCLPHIKENQIVHIPMLLYFRRHRNDQLAIYTVADRVKALQNHFEERGERGRVTVEPGQLEGTTRLRWSIPAPAPLVSLLIPTRDTKWLAEKAVLSILDKTDYPNYEILLLDNGSVEEETLTWFAKLQCDEPRVRVLRWDHPFNYSAINNFGARQARGSVLGFVNNDIEVINREWLTEMVSHAVREDIGCVGAKLLYSNGMVQHGGVILGIGGVAGHAHRFFGRNDPGYQKRLAVVQNYSAVTAACLVVRRKLFFDVGGFDEVNLPIALNDIDLCLKVGEAGYRNVWTPHAMLYHHESLSRGYDDTKEKRARALAEQAYMKRRWRERLARDPYYNPNLTLEREDFSLGR